jgi:hypothetical protein
MSIEAAVALAIEGADPVLAAQALELARLLDDSENSATSKSMANKELRETMAEIRALNPPKPQEDEIERARNRRADRLAGKSAAGSSPSS